MAADTPVKRFSAINIGSPWRGILPIPDGDIDQGDRQVVFGLYSGILAAALAVPATRVFAKMFGGPVTKGTTRGGVLFRGTQR